MQVDIDFQKALKYMGDEIARLNMDMAVKNAYIDQQIVYIQSLQGQLGEYAELLEKKSKGKASGKIIDMPQKSE